VYCVTAAGLKSLRRHMSSDSVISALSAVSQQSLMSAAADVDRKKKKNKNWVRNIQQLSVLFFGLTVSLLSICFCYLTVT